MSVATKLLHISLLACARRALNCWEKWLLEQGVTKQEINDQKVAV
jgi:hypothetical protein